LEIRGSDILISVGVAALYVAAAKLGLGLAFRAQQVTAVWPPTGLALAAILRYGRRAVPGVLLGAFFANATADEPLWVAGGIALGNTLEALTASALLTHVGFDGRLARLRDVTSLLGALAVAPAVSATIGVASLGAGGVQPASSLPELWSVWWLGDALGGLIFAPLLLLWTNREAIPRRRFAAVEGAAVLAGLFVGCVIAFSELPPAPVSEYIVFPFLIWGALRFGHRGCRGRRLRRVGDPRGFRSVRRRGPRARPRASADLHGGGRHHGTSSRRRRRSSTSSAGERSG
jgi:integral membrane sensor domain MASE1